MDSIVGRVNAMPNKYYASLHFDVLFYENHLLMLTICDACPYSCSAVLLPKYISCKEMLLFSSPYLDLRAWIRIIKSMSSPTKSYFRKWICTALHKTHGFRRTPESRPLDFLEDALLMYVSERALMI